MGRKLYVGNLPFSATEEDISAKFAQCGTVESAKLITDRDTGRSKGFGFVEMSSDSEAQAAIEKLNGADYDGRPMTVNEARPQKKRSGPGGGGGGGRGGYGGGGGGYGGGGGGNRW
jgi:RNA recognition motif-containing protein